MDIPRPILFCDFDGTLCHQRYWRSLPAGAYEKVQDLLFRKETTMVRNWMVGKHTSEEVNGHVAQVLEMPPADLWELFVTDCSNMEVNQEALEKIKQLRNRFTTILVTVNMDSFSRFTSPALQLEKYFDVISNSYHEGKHKADNEGELFREYAAKFGVPISECVLIDDNQKVLDVFKAIGGKVCPITPEKDVSYYLNRL